MQGKKTRSGIFADCRLAKLNNFYFDQYNKPICVHGDPAYPLRSSSRGVF